MKVDPKKGMAVVMIGQMKWDVRVDELIPQIIREPEVGKDAGRPAPRLG